MKTYICNIVASNKPTFPVNLNKKVENNCTGLCNQLFKFINGIFVGDARNNEIYFDLFSMDNLKGDLMPLSNIINLDKMRSSYNLKLYDIIDLKSPNNCFLIDDGFVFRTYLSSIDTFNDIANKIIFSDKFESFSKFMIDNEKIDVDINIGHLRIDQDMKDHIIKHYGEVFYNQVVQDYKNEILLNCDKSKPLLLLMDQIDHPLVIELQKEYDIRFFTKEKVNESYKKFFNEDFPAGREMYAFVDFLIGKNLACDNFICSKGSSFSILLSTIKKDFKKLIIINDN